MVLKQIVKKSFLYYPIIYSNYLVKRYLVKGLFRPYSLSHGFKLLPVDQGICFFGYYNLTPENGNKDVLYLKVNQEKIRGSIHEPARIIIKKSDGTINQVAETKAWNWQQGCMLQWLPNSENHIIFNDYDEKRDKYVSKVINTNGEFIRTYDMPVNNVSKNGEYALSLNYSRLARMRQSYGYFNKKYSVLPSDTEDGVWYIDLKSGRTDIIISLERLKNICYSSSMEKAEHKVNHIDTNLSGTRFMFLHRWVGPKGRFMRLITANRDGSDLLILNGDKMISHSCWITNNRILSYCEYKEKRGYFEFKDRSKEVKFFSEKMPRVDGHPSVSPDGEWIITDTYPDNSRMSYLYLFNIKTYEIMKIGRFYQPLRYKNEMRIDLHPKWSWDKESIFFESGHTGERKLHKISINY